MPPKYKMGGKKFPPRIESKPLPKQITTDDDPTSTEASSGLDLAVENQFELELCWCIQQLQLTLDTGKISEKQLADSTKSLNLLKSHRVPLIKKRQAMRNIFGDYRAKMIQDEKKHGKYVSNVKFSTPKLDSNKSVFLKKAGMDSVTKTASHEKSSGLTIDAEKPNSKVAFVMSREPSDVPFTFSFSVPEST